MNTEYQIQIQNFEGPMEKLLELIEGKQLPVTSVSLAEVTGDFLEYLKKLKHIHPKVLADFIAVASRLILIKSHTLLPQLQLSADEEGEIAELEERLRKYKELKNAEKNIKELWSKNISFGRSFLMDFAPGFYLSQKFSPDDLLLVLRKVAEELAIALPAKEEGTVEMVNFEEKLKELMERVDKTITSSFNDIISGKERSEVIVLFLALLHLLKDSAVSIEQKGDFNDIAIVKS